MVNENLKFLPASGMNFPVLTSVYKINRKTNFAVSYLKRVEAKFSSPKICFGRDEVDPHYVSLVIIVLSHAKNNNCKEFHFAASNNFPNV